MLKKSKLHSLKDVGNPIKKPKLPKAQTFASTKESMDILMKALRCWDNFSKFRKDRYRNKRYVEGDQWSDRICVNGKWMSEEDYIKSQGHVPLINNLTNRLVNSVVGVYKSQQKEPTCTARDRDEQQLGETMSTVLQYNWQRNSMQKLNAKGFRELLIGGMAVMKKTYGWRNDTLDCWTDFVRPNDFFIDTAMSDFRGWDVSFIGQIHEITLEEVLTKFAKCPKDKESLRQIFANARNINYLAGNCEQFGYPRLHQKDFLMPMDSSMCRVIEVWSIEQKDRYHCIDPQNGEMFKIDAEDFDELVGSVNANRQRMAQEVGMPEEDVPYISAEYFVDSFWKYRFLTPTGQVLDEGETPYNHGSHPYCFEIYPFLDGSVRSFVADVIDQQRYVNRLVTMYDWIMRSSAKGVLLFPEALVPDDMSMEDIADEWTRYNGVIFMKSKPGVEMPRQISNNATNIGINEMINLQLKFFEDISSVHGALQGKAGYSGQSASLYAQQTQSSTMGLLDLLDTYSDFEVQCAKKDVKNIQQYYDHARVVNIAGRDAVTYDPEVLADVEFDLGVIESTTTPAYRMYADEFVKQLWAAGAINAEQMLSNISQPFADKLLQSIKAQNEQIQQGQMPQGGMPAEAMAQATQQANPQAVNAAYNAMRG